MSQCPLNSDRCQENGTGESCAPDATVTAQCIVTSHKALLNLPHDPLSPIEDAWLACVSIARRRSMLPPSNFTTFRFRKASMTHEAISGFLLKQGHEGKWAIQFLNDPPHLPHCFLTLIHAGLNDSTPPCQWCCTVKAADAGRAANKIRQQYGSRVMVSIAKNP